MGRKRKIVYVAGVLCMGVGSQAGAVNVPLLNPGFDSFVTSTGGAFHYEGVQYTTGDFIPNHSFLTGIPGGGFDAFIADSHSGAQILNDDSTANATGAVSGYTGSPAANTGSLYDDRDWNPGQGPDRAAGFISLAGPVSTAAIYQVNSGNSYQPNTHYTFTVQVSDRFAIQPNDVVSFPSSVTAAFMDGLTEITTGVTQNFTAPTNGNTSVLRLDFTTGVTAPTGQIGFVLRASGQTGGAATQVFFDNAALNGVSLAQVYWDTNGTTAGPGGTTPSGTWDGATANFNTDSTGGAAGEFVSATNTGQTVFFAADATATGAYTVTLSGTRSAAAIVVEEGNLTLSGGTLATGAFDVRAGATASVNSTVSGGSGGSVTKIGPGTLTLFAANTYTGGTTISAGNLVLANADASAGGAINVANGALAQAQSGLPKAVTVTTLATNASGKFDLTNNSMVVKAMTSGQVRALIVPAYNAGAWNGPTGLTSSTAAGGTSTGIGYADNAVLGLTSFKGVDVGPADVLVKYTYYGDADLDGDVDGNDVGRWATNFTGSGGSTTKTWAEGDWDYDGDVDGNDVGRWAVNFTGSGGGTLNIPNAQPEAVAMLEAMGFTVVPEPTGVVVVAFASLSLARRRRREGRMGLSQAHTAGVSHA
jgi:autotransporter-associated beta strand protein